MAGAGLAISLSYLALERFRYRRDVEMIANKLHEKFENDGKLQNESGMEHLNELRWLGRKSCNGHAPTGGLSAPYAILYRTHGDILIVGFLSVVAAIVLVAGTAGSIQLVGEIATRWVVLVAFFGCASAMVLPALGIVLGHRCRTWAIKRAHECDDQIATILAFSAKTAALGPSADGAAPAQASPPKGKRKTKWLGFVPILGRK